MYEFKDTAKLNLVQDKKYPLFVHQELLFSSILF
jgi:hypothetical protein